MKLRPYQTAAIDGARKAFMGDPKTGTPPARAVICTLPTGCHARGQGILMYDGSIKRVEDIVVGDRLMGPDSTPRTVLALARGRQEMARIVPTKGDPWIVNMDHVLTLGLTGQGRPGWHDMTVREWMGLAKGGKHIRKLVRTGVEFPSVGETPMITPYALGVLIGDGSLKRTTQVNKPEPELHKAMMQESAKMGGEWVVRGDVGHFAGTRGPGGNAVLTELARLDLRVNSGEKHIPREYLTRPHADRLDLLAGLIDTDGSLTCGGYDWSSKSADLARDFAFLARSLGLAAYVHPCEKVCQTGGGGTYYRVSISGDCSVIPCRIARKRAPPRRQVKDVLCTSFTVERLPEDDYYGFELDGDHRYLLDDFTVTHNTGKSIIFKAIAEGVARKGRRVLLLVEGVKLVTQAAAHLRTVGLTVGIEMAEETAIPEHGLTDVQRQLLDRMPREGDGLFVKGPAIMSATILVDRGLAQKVKPAQEGAGGWYVRTTPEPPQVVVASVDSMINRLDLYPPDTFRMVIVDETHHAIAPTYLQVFQHFGISVPLNEPKEVADLKKSEWKYDTLLFGLTATPDRGDKRDLMRLYEVVGYEYDIRSAINDGWLVPIRQEFCHLEGLDLRKVRKTAGDLDAKQLCQLLEPLMVPICDAIVKTADGRPTLCYSPLVNLAESTTARLRMVAPDRQIETITGKTEDDDRERWFRALDRGELWALSSVGTLTEGVDLPRAAVAAMLRLTTSRLLYAQILGRVLRPAPEIAEALNDCANADQRKALIASSSKPYATILDFAGNACKHKLVRALDIIADPDDPGLSIAENLVEKQGIDPLEALARAHAELAKMLAAAKGKEIQKMLIDPFDLLDVEHKSDSWGRPATDNQIRSLLNAGVVAYKPDDPRSVEDALAKLRKMFDMTSASVMLAERSRRIDQGLASPAQVRTLVKFGMPVAVARQLGFEDASSALDNLASQEWRATPAWIRRYTDLAAPCRAAAA